MKHLFALLLFACAVSAPAAEKILGIYVHTHWPYNHPYAARTWTVEDWRGYLGGMRTLGFNTVLFWPLVETMPHPLTPSDRRHLDKTAQVIAVAQKELGMRMFLVLCPNIVADDAVASQADFDRRHFFHSDLRVNPADPAAVAAMMRRREEVLRPLAAADGLVIIDSDPGGYAGSTNAEFVGLLAEHRKLLDRLRPGVELVYWMHAGWPAYSRFYASGSFKRGTEAENEEALSLLKARQLEPWGVANNLPLARRLGLEDRVINFRYGQIETEPQFPLTNFWSERAYAAGGDEAPRGIIGNAQSHVVQLPNTFAFARGARRQPIGPDDYRQFAEQLVPTHGRAIERAWRAFASKDAAEMRAAADGVARPDPATLRGGPLQGLIFRDPARYLADLALQLEVAAAYAELLAAHAAKADLVGPLGTFAAAATAWQQRTGYQNQWKWPELRQLLATLNSPEINAVLDPVYFAETPFGRVKEGYYRKEKETTRLLDAIRTALTRMTRTPSAR
jgi:hypothetical protein